MRGEVDTSRLETFSDGVFAIAITLLIIGVGIKAEGGSLTYRLAESLALPYPRTWAAASAAEASTSASMVENS